MVVVGADRYVLAAQRWISARYDSDDVASWSLRARERERRESQPSSGSSRGHCRWIPANQARRNRWRNGEAYTRWSRVGGYRDRIWPDRARIVRGYYRARLGVSTDDRPRIADQRSPNREEERFALDLVRRDQRRRVGEVTSVDDLYAVDWDSAPRCREARDVVRSVRERSAVEEYLRTGLHGNPVGGHILEIAATRAARLNSKPRQLVRDVLGALEIALRSELTAHHRVVGEYVQPRAQVARGDLSGCRSFALSHLQRRSASQRQGGSDRDEFSRNEQVRSFSSGQRTKSRRESLQRQSGGFPHRSSTDATTVQESVTVVPPMMEMNLPLQMWRRWSDPANAARSLGSS